MAVPPPEKRPRLSPGGALRVDVERKHRRAAAHEEAVAIAPAEAQVGAALGQVDAADQLGLAVEDIDAVQRLAAHAPAHPEVALDIYAEAVGRAASLGGEEHLSLWQARAALGPLVK